MYVCMYGIDQSWRRRSLGHFPCFTVTSNSVSQNNFDFLALLHIIIYATCSSKKIYCIVYLTAQQEERDRKKEKFQQSVQLVHSQ